MGNSFFKYTSKCILTLLMAVSALSFGSTVNKVKADEIPNSCCDVNKDNVVDDNDVSYLKNVLFGSEKPTESCDINNDGSVNIFDFSLLKKKIFDYDVPEPSDETGAFLGKDSMGIISLFQKQMNEADIESLESPDAFENSNIFFGGRVTSATMDSLLSNANDAIIGRYYTLRFTAADVLPLNLPFTEGVQSKTDYALLFTFGDENYKEQIVIDRAGRTFARMGVVSNGHWFPWTQSSDSGVVIHVGKGQIYTKLTDAMKYAFEHKNTTVYVHEGTYDIIEEMGSEYWENFSGYNDLTHAMIGNGSHFVFCADSKVICNYTGDNKNVKTLYSPFNSLYGCEGDFIIEGMNLEVSGCRYAIHDDVGASIVEQTHKYINCDISNDIRCIGAGLGSNETVLMQDCIFRSTGSIGNSPVSWHNSGGGTTGKSSIVMTGCYVTGNGQNTAQFLAYGISPKLSKVLVSNCCFGAEIICKKYDETIPYMNFEMFAFNNTIRNENSTEENNENNNNENNNEGNNEENNENNNEQNNEENNENSNVENNEDNNEENGNTEEGSNAEEGNTSEDNGNEENNESENNTNG